MNISQILSIIRYEWIQTYFLGNISSCFKISGEVFFERFVFISEDLNLHKLNCQEFRLLLLVPHFGNLFQFREIPF